MNLEQFRHEIDSIDDAILELLIKRMHVVKHIGELKKQSQTSIYRPEREREILSRLIQKNAACEDSPLIAEAIEAIYMEIFAVSRNLELPERVAYLGPIGSYTHQAAEGRFGGMGHYMSMNTISAVFHAVENKRAKYGVIPIENNQNGAVGETLDNLARTPLKIVAEVVLPIHHCFASMSDSPDNIKRIYSKDIAFGQCHEFLNQHNLESSERISVESTARAAQLAMDDPQSAAICSHVAAKIYALPILFERIEDFSSNKTRFVIVSDFENKPSGNDKTSLCVDLANSDKPGVLARFLAIMEKAGVNMTKIESRPKRNHDNDAFEFQFFIEIDGHILDSNIQRICNTDHDIKWLGSYLKAT